MARISKRFEELRRSGRKALIPYLTAGYPDLETSRLIALATIDAGADFLEIGVPFSDPIADGSTIQYSSQSALDAGVTPEACLDMAGRVASERPDVPILIMTYVNPVLAFGLESWLTRMEQHNVTGLILPDVSLESYRRWQDVFEKHERVELVQLASVVSPVDRLEALAAHTRGFLYVVSVTGVTGAGQSFDARLSERMAAIRALTDGPLAIGFGVDGPESAATLAQLGDGVIVGSWLVDAIRSVEPRHAPQTVSRWVASLRKSIDHSVSSSMTN